MFLSKESGKIQLQDVTTILPHPFCVLIDEIDCRPRKFHHVLVASTSFLGKVGKAVQDFEQGGEGVFMLEREQLVPKDWRRKD